MVPPRRESIVSVEDAFRYCELSSRHLISSNFGRQLLKAFIRHHFPHFNSLEICQFITCFDMTEQALQDISNFDTSLLTEILRRVPNEPLTERLYFSYFIVDINRTMRITTTLLKIQTLLINLIELEPEYAAFKDELYGVRNEAIFNSITH